MTLQFSTSRENCHVLEYESVHFLNWASSLFLHFKNGHLTRLAGVVKFLERIELTFVNSDIIIKDKDIVKLDLGVHIDGMIAVVAHTVFLSADKKGKAVDAMLAAHYCAEAALRLVTPGVEVI